MPNGVGVAFLAAPGVYGYSAYPSHSNDSRSSSRWSAIAGLEQRGHRVIEGGQSTVQLRPLEGLERLGAQPHPRGAGVVVVDRLAPHAHRHPEADRVRPRQQHDLQALVLAWVVDHAVEV